jgi:hypothetical protein
MARRRISQTPQPESVESVLPIEIESFSQGEDSIESVQEESQSEPIVEASPIEEVIEQEPEVVTVSEPVQSIQPVNDGIEGIRFEGGLYRVELNVNDTLTYFGSYEYLNDALIVRDKVLSRFS